MLYFHLNKISVVEVFLPMNDVKNDVLSFLNQIFEGNRKHTEKFSEELENHQHGQDPRLTTVVCSDSRVMQHEMW